MKIDRKTWSSSRCIELKIEFLLLLSHDPEINLRWNLRRLMSGQQQHNARSHLNDFTAISHRWFMRIVDRRKGKMNVHLNPKFKLGFLNFQKKTEQKKRNRFQSNETKRQKIWIAHPSFHLPDQFNQKLRENIYRSPKRR